MTLLEYLDSLTDESKKTSMAELRRLSGLDRSRIEEFQGGWRALPVGRRRQMVQAMADLAEDNVELDFTAVFRACLSDPDEEVRAHAVDGLWEDEELSTAAHLLDLLAGDPSQRVRAAAASGLARFVYRMEMRELSPTMAHRIRGSLLATVRSRTEPVEVRRRALEAISYLSEPEVRDLIAQAYADAEEKMRVSAVFAMGRNCHSAWLDPITREMKSPSPEMRYEAVRAAGELEDERAVGPLVSLLVDDDREVRLAAIAALGAIGGEAALRALRYVAENGDDEAKLAAAEALAELAFADDPLGLRADLTN